MVGWIKKWKKIDGWLDGQKKMKKIDGWLDGQKKYKKWLDG